MKYNTLSGESSIKGPAPENTDMSVPPAAVQTPDSPLLLLNAAPVLAEPTAESPTNSARCGEARESTKPTANQPLQVGVNVDSRGGAQLLDWEPEQAWGTPWDFREHVQRGGTLEDY